jgi:hypothetical protein
MADARGGVTNAIMAQPTGGFAGQAVATRGGVAQAPSPYGGGFTSFAPRPRPAVQGGAGFAPPPSNMVGGFAPPPPMMAPGAAPPTSGFAPPASNLFAAPPTGALPTGGVAQPPPRPAFNAQFSPGALQYPGGNAMRGRGY